MIVINVSLYSLTFVRMILIKKKKKRELTFSKKKRPLYREFKERHYDERATKIGRYDSAAGRWSRVRR